MKFNDVAGSVTVDPRHAVVHLTTWFDKDDLVCLVGIRAKRGTGKNVIAQVVKAADLVQTLHGADGAQLLEGLCVSDDGEQWNVYVGVSSAEHELTSITKRGGLDNVKAMPGVWADFDVKEGSFQTQDEILSFMRHSLPEPSMVIATGSGGVHGYWKTSKPLGLTLARETQKRWWCLLAEQAGEKAIDHLIDTSRILRLAGTVRWPRSDENTVPTPVRVIHVNRENTYPVETIYGLSNDAYTQYDSRIRQTRVNDAQNRLDADEMAKIALGEGTWATYAAIGQIEELFSELVTWDDILVPQGWTFLREDGQGRREWARSGRMDKSATTDWPDSPDVMSLLSWSDETGLADLRDAGIALTKYRVGLRLLWEDDTVQLINDVMAHRRDTAHSSCPLC